MMGGEQLALDRTDKLGEFQRGPYDRIVENVLQVRIENGLTFGKEPWILYTLRRGKHRRMISVADWFSDLPGCYWTRGSDAARAIDLAATLGIST